MTLGRGIAIAGIWIGVGIAGFLLMRPATDDHWCSRAEMADEGECAGVLVGTFRRNSAIPDWLEHASDEKIVATFARPAEVFLTKQDRFYVFPLDDGDTPVLSFECPYGVCSGSIKGRHKGVRIDWLQPGA